MGLSCSAEQRISPNWRAAGGAPLGPFVEAWAGWLSEPGFGNDRLKMSGLYVHAGREAAGIARSKIALVIHEKHFVRHDVLVWAAYGTTQPAYVLTLDGVPLVSVYVRPSVARD